MAGQSRDSQRPPRARRVPVTAVNNGPPGSRAVTDNRPDAGWAGPVPMAMPCSSTDTLPVRGRQRREPWDEPGTNCVGDAGWGWRNLPERESKAGAARSLNAQIRVALGGSIGRNWGVDCRRRARSRTCASNFKIITKRLTSESRGPCLSVNAWAAAGGFACSCSVSSSKGCRTPGFAARKLVQRSITCNGTATESMGARYGHA
jgi:hypothetical protein